MLKKLAARRMTASELAAELGMKVQSAAEHLEKMEAAGLVSREKRAKWVYYALTQKGRAVAEPGEKRVWMLLGTIVIALAFAGGALVIWQTALQAPHPSALGIEKGLQPAQWSGSGRAPLPALGEGVAAAAAQATPTPSASPGEFNASNETSLPAASPGSG